MNPLEANVEIGDFRIIRRIGAGGMGIVYLAQQKSLNRKVALKVLGASLSHPGDILRFKREAQAVARLSHPGIAAIYYTGQDQQACYMAMEYIDGATLRSVILRLATTENKEFAIRTLLQDDTQPESCAPQLRFDDLTVEATPSFHLRDVAARSALLDLTPEAEAIIGTKQYIQWVCSVIRDAAVALDHAHRHGVIHRDIKPQNIMLDRDGRVHVIDFGIARYFEDVSLTQTGQLVGTPMYMSPEQVAERLNIDHRCDVYSLGLVMYELLTLRRPLLAPTRDAILRGVLTKAMIPVSWRNSGVPRSLESVVHKAIAKDPDERYQHAVEFAEDLQRCLSGQAVLAEPYRYRFDERAIRAERPWAVTASAFWFYFVAIFYALVWSPYQIGMNIANPAGARAAPKSPIGYVWIVAGYLVLAGISAYLAPVVLSGRKWARWAAIPIAVIAVGLSLKQPAQILYNTWLHKNYRFLALMSVWLAIQSVVVLGGCFTILVMLAHQATRRWFEFSRQVRSEHAGLLSTPKNKMSRDRITRRTECSPPSVNRPGA